MRRLHLDFLHPSAPRAWIGVAVLALGVATAGVAGWRYQALRGEVDHLDARIEDTKRMARRELPRVREVGGDPKQLAQEVTRANAVLASLALPWDAMFRTIESAGSDNVALVAIQPDGAGRQFRLQGEARRFEDMLAYIVRLESTAGFTNVLLAGHEMKTVGGVRAVGFTLTADWVGER
jgi:Tfp pilus assembly protein PilN